MAQSVARGSPTAGLPAWISPQLTQLVDAAIIDVISQLVIPQAFAKNGVVSCSIDQRGKISSP
jgi:hypothetical protein